MEKEQFDQALGDFISRREMLQIMGIGTVGALAFPALNRRALGQRPLPVQTPDWSYPVPNENGNAVSLATSPVFYKGTVIYITQLNSPPFGFTVYCIDSRTRETRWTTPLPFSVENILGGLAVQDGLVYLAAGLTNDSNNALFVINPENGNISPQITNNISVVPVVADGKLIFTTSDGFLHAVDPADPSTAIWPPVNISADPNQVTSPLIFANNIYIHSGNEVIARRLADGSPVWPQPFQVPSQQLGGSLSGLSAGNGHIYCWSNDGAVYAVDAYTGVQSWMRVCDQTASGFSEAPVFSGGLIYIGDGRGILSVIDSNKGTIVRQLEILQGSGLQGTTLFVEDGVGYVTAAASTSKFFSVDLTTGSVGGYDPRSSGYIFAVESGVCYCVQGNLNTIIALDLADLVHQFFCETELMVEDYSATDGRPDTTSFRTHVQVLDTNKNPRINRSIRVWASGPVTITTDDGTFEIDTDKSAWLTTDTTGELSIVSSATGSPTPSTTTASFTSPALYLWGNFMELNEAMVIYPDHDTLTKLSTASAQDLTSAKTYDGGTLLPATFTGAAALAQVINNTIGNPASGMTGLQRSNGQLITGAPVSANKYVAYTGASSNLAYQPIETTTARPFVPAGVQQWVADFDANGNTTFSTVIPLSANRRGNQLGSSSFEEFLHYVHDLGKKIVKIVYTAVRNAVQHVIHFADAVFTLTVNTFEDAAKVLSGIFKSVLGDLGKAVQWLSFIFDWDSIKTTKDNYKAQATAAIDGPNGLKAMIASQIRPAISDVNSFFINAEASVANAFNSIAAALGSRSLQSQQSNGNDPRSIWGRGGGKTYTKTRWLTSKFKDNAKGAAFPTLADDDPIHAAVTAFEQQIEGITAVQDIPDEIKKFVSSFSSLITNPSKFVATSIGDLLNLIRDFVITLCQVANLIVVDFLSLLEAGLDAILGLIQKEFDHIPVISDIYRYISGRELSALDLFCLVVAVPTTIVSKLIAPSPGRVANLQSYSELGLFAGFAGVIYALFDGLGDIVPDLPYQFKFANVTLSLLQLSFTVPVVGSIIDRFVYAASALPTIAGGFEIWLGNRDDAGAINPAIVQKYKFISPIAYSFYGLISVYLAIAAGVLDNHNAPRKNYVPMIQNLFGALPYMCKPIGFFGGETDANPANIALGMIDIACDLTVAGLEIEQAV